MASYGGPSEDEGPGPDTDDAADTLRMAPDQTGPAGFEEVEKASTAAGSDLSGGSMRCFWCTQIGHYARDCPAEVKDLTTKSLLELYSRFTYKGKQDRRQEVPFFKEELMVRGWAEREIPVSEETRKSALAWLEGHMAGNTREEGCLAQQDRPGKRKRKADHVNKVEVRIARQEQRLAAEARAFSGEEKRREHFLLQEASLAGLEDAAKGAREGQAGRPASSRPGRGAEATEAAEMMEDEDTVDRRLRLLNRLPVATLHQLTEIGGRG